MTSVLKERGNLDTETRLHSGNPATCKARGEAWDRPALTASGGARLTDTGTAASRPPDLWEHFPLSHSVVPCDGNPSKWIRTVFSPATQRQFSYRLCRWKVLLALLATDLFFREFSLWGIPESQPMSCDWKRGTKRQEAVALWPSPGLCFPLCNADAISSPSPCFLPFPGSAQGAHFQKSTGLQWIFPSINKVTSESLAMLHCRDWNNFTGKPCADGSLLLQLLVCH